MTILPLNEQETVNAIYEHYRSNQGKGYRYHLGASLIGDNCERSLWYSFRWATVSQHDGRLLRLFDTGNHAETRFVNDLRNIGVMVHDTEPGDSTKQIGVRDDFGHFGGSLDAIALGLLEAPKTWHICEFKTHGDKSYKSLTKDGVQKSKPRHYAQMQVYMHLMGLERAFYLAVNKNTDEMYSERVNHDSEFAMRMITKARRIIKANEPPQKISENPDWFECRFCDHKAVCHEDMVPERHCRSCIHSTPVEGGEWICARNSLFPDNEKYYSSFIPREIQEVGCPLHIFIPEFIALPQDDCVVNKNGIIEGIVYLMPDGEKWVDGVPF